MFSTVGTVWSIFSYLSHDSNRGFSSGLSHSVFHQVEHVFIVQQANQVEGPKTGCAAQSEVPDNHGAAVEKEKWDGMLGEGKRRSDSSKGSSCYL